MPNPTRSRRTGRRLLPLTVGALVACTGLVACATDDGEEFAHCEQVDEFSFGSVGVNAGTLLPVYADSAGLWAEQCLDFDFVVIPNSADLLTATYSGDLQAVTVPTVNGFSAINSGMDLIAVASNQNINDASFMARPDVETGADLNGGTIGTASIESAATLAMEDILAEDGLSENDYEIVSGGGTAERAAGLQSGNFDGTWLLAPYNLQLIDEGYTELGVLGETAPDDVFGAVFSDREWAENNVDMMNRIVRVWADATEAFHDPANRDAFVDTLIEDIGATPEMAEATYERYQSLDVYSEDARIGPVQVVSVLDQMLRIGIIDEIPSDIDQYVTMRYWADATGNPEIVMELP